MVYSVKVELDVLDEKSDAIRLDYNSVVLNIFITITLQLCTNFCGLYGNV